MAPRRPAAPGAIPLAGPSAFGRTSRSGIHELHELLVVELHEHELRLDQLPGRHELEPQLRARPGFHDGREVVPQLRPPGTAAAQLPDLEAVDRYSSSFAGSAGRQTATCCTMACAYSAAPGPHILRRPMPISRPPRASELQSASIAFPGPPGRELWEPRGPNCGPSPPILRDQLMHPPPHGGQRQ